MVVVGVDVVEYRVWSGACYEFGSGERRLSLSRNLTNTLFIVEVCGRNELGKVIL